MSGIESRVTVTGNITADPELRQAGEHPVCNFTIAVQPRRVNRETGELVNADPVFMRCTAWRGLAEHVAVSLRKGDRVIGYGELQQETFTGRDGVQHTVVKLLLDDVGVSLRFGLPDHL